MTDETGTPPLPTLSDWLATSETRRRGVLAAILHDLADDVAAGRARLVQAEAAQLTPLPNGLLPLTLYFEVPPSAPASAPRNPAT